MGRNRTQETRGKIYEDFGNKIKELRESKKMTQTELANEIGISRTNLAQYESGVRKVPLNIIVIFSDYFNVSVNELIGIDNNKDDEINEPCSLLYKQLSKELGSTQLTNDEIDKIVDFAKFLISQRKQ